MAIKQTPELERLMQEASDKNADYVYMMPNEPPAFRIKNNIERGQGDPFTTQQISKIASAAFAENDLKTLGIETGQLSTFCTLPGIVDAHMQVSKAGSEYCICLYLLPKTLPTVDDVKLPRAILKAAMSSRGLILFSGPGSSGKTTSMLSTLDYVNCQRACMICTVEYATTYRLVPKKALIQQREVGIDTPDMMTGISASLSQGSDVLMIGELRGLDEIKMCIMAAQANLVFSQLHADTPQGALQRVIDIFPQDIADVPRRILAERLQLVCAQKLLERADGKGRVATYGVLIPDEHMRKAIAEGQDFLKRKTPLPKNCQSMVQDINKLHKDGIISKKIKDMALLEIQP